jgi:4'-phosphopantetheinyl transferase
MTAAESIDIAPGELHVWSGTIVEMRGGAGDALRCLTEHEREQASRFRDPADRERFALSRGALRSILARCMGREPWSIELIRTPDGKPHLPPPCGLHFNVSHSHERVLIAVATDPVGVDVEYRRRPVDAAALHSRFFAADRAGPEHFFDLWVRREALLKATGIGLAAMDAPEPQGWRVDWLDIDPEYAAAVAWQGAAARRIVFHRLTARPGLPVDESSCPDTTESRP